VDSDLACRPLPHIKTDDAISPVVRGRLPKYRNEASEAFTILGTICKSESNQKQWFLKSVLTLFAFEILIFCFNKVLLIMDR